MKHPPMLLRSSPLLSNGFAIREWGRHQWPGEARSTVSAGVACSAAFSGVRVRPFRALWVART
jgi:hypothetical protein